MNIINNLILVVSLSFGILYILGLFKFIVRHEETEQCQMTYMYQYPQFIRIRFPENLDYPQYGLMAYKEGFRGDHRNLKFRGVPVLFIPGNGGSYKQVRSLSSIALRKAFKYGGRPHFDFFCVDLNEDLSGLFGGVLEPQSQFVNHSIHRILSLYAENPEHYTIPTSVILIGHSMGGMVALKVLTNPEDAKNVDLIITLSTPHLRPAVVLDWQVLKFYEEVDKVWNPRKDYLLNKTVITIGSGYNDILVNTHLTQSSYTNLHVVTTEIPKVWADVPHVVLVWCRQLVMTIIQSLFDAVNEHTLQLETSHDTRLEIFNHHMIENSGIKRRQRERLNGIEKVNNKFFGLMDLRGGIHNASKNLWVIMPYDVTNDSYTDIIIQCYNYPAPNWIYACIPEDCGDSYPCCRQIAALTDRSRIVPSTGAKRRVFTLSREEYWKEFGGLQFFVVRYIGGNIPNFVRLDVDKYIPADRTVEVTIPYLTFRWEQTVLSNTEPKALIYIIKLKNFDNLYQALHLSVESECQSGYYEYQAIATLKTPWALSDFSGYFTQQHRKPMPIVLFSPKPTNISENITAYIELSLDSRCQYKIKLESNFLASLENFVRHYSLMLLGNFGAILILLLRYQLYTDKSACHSIHGIFANAVSPFEYLKTSYVAFTLLSSDVFKSYLFAPDALILQAENMYFMCLPVILFLCGIGLTYAVATVLWFSVVIGRFMTQKLAINYLCRKLFGSIMLTEWIFNLFLTYFTPVVAFGAFLVWYWSSGAVALIIIVTFYYFKLIKIYEDYLENLVFASLKYLAGRCRALYEFIRWGPYTEPKFCRLRDIDYVSDGKKDVVVPSISEISKTAGSNKKDLSTSTKAQNKLRTNESVNQQETEGNVISRKSSDRTSVSSDDDFEQIDIAAMALTYEESDHQDYIQYEPKRFCPDITDKKKRDRLEEILTEETGGKGVKLHHLHDALRKFELEEEDEEDRQKIEELEIEKKEHLKVSNAFNFHFTIFLISLVITGVTIPSALTWARNYGFGKISLYDPSSIPMLLTCTSVMIFWGIDDVRLNLTNGVAVSSLLYFVAVLCSIYSTLQVYRLPYFLSFSLLLVAIHQKFAQEEEIEDEHILTDNQVEDMIEEDVDEITEVEEVEQVEQESSPKPKSD